MPPQVEKCPHLTKFTLSPKHLLPTSLPIMSSQSLLLDSSFPCQTLSPTTFSPPSNPPYHHLLPSLLYLHLFLNWHQVPLPSIILNALLLGGSPTWPLFLLNSLKSLILMTLFLSLSLIGLYQFLRYYLLLPMDPWNWCLRITMILYWLMHESQQPPGVDYMLVPQSAVSPGHHPMQDKLVCKHKWDNSDAVSQYKVRYVAKGYAQIFGVDYEKTTAPTTCLESFRIILCFCFSWLKPTSVQYQTAFLHGVLPSEKIAYMKQPPGFEEPGKENWVWN